MEVICGSGLPPCAVAVFEMQWVHKTQLKLSDQWVMFLSEKEGHKFFIEKRTTRFSSYRGKECENEKNDLRAIPLFKVKCTHIYLHLSENSLSMHFKNKHKHEYLYLHFREHCLPSMYPP